jgi:holo-[acyl-carrier protein] synthase
VYERRRKRSAQRGTAFLATRFAAKEAISKAVGLGMRMPMSWRAVEIVNEPGGRPCAIANGPFAAFLEGRGLRLHVSVADIASVAVAHAVAETVDG